MQGMLLALLVSVGSIFALAPSASADPVTVGPATLDGTNSTIDPTWGQNANVSAGPAEAAAVASLDGVSVSKVCLQSTSYCIVGGPCAGYSENGYQSGVTADSNGVQVMIPRFNILPGLRAGISTSCPTGGIVP